MAEPRGRSGGTNRDTGSRGPRLSRWNDPKNPREPERQPRKGFPPDALKRRKPFSADSLEDKIVGPTRPPIPPARMPTVTPYDILRKDRAARRGAPTLQVSFRTEEPSRTPPPIPGIGSHIARPAPESNPMDRMFGGPADPHPEVLPDFDAEAALRILERLAMMPLEGVGMLNQRTNNVIERLAEQLGMTPQPFWETLGRPTPAWATAPSINPNDSVPTKLKKYIQDKLLGYTGEES